VRMNALAWVGIAAVAYRKATGSHAHDKLIDGLADYLLNSRRPDGLVPGGPEVQWVSTQQNLLMAEFFRSGAKELGRQDLRDAYDKAAAALIKDLFHSGYYAWFIQGLGDEDRPLDAQVLGTMFFWLRDRTLGENPFPFLNLSIGDKFWVDHGGWTGFRPYWPVQEGTPDIVWTEGTLMAAWVFQRTGIAGSGVKARTDQAVAQIVARTKGETVGPPAADRASDTKRWGEYPAWPAAAPASWLLILQGGGDVLFAP
jgi:hypothetical protein